LCELQKAEGNSQACRNMEKERLNLEKQKEIHMRSEIWKKRSEMKRKVISIIPLQFWQLLFFLCIHFLGSWWFSGAREQKRKARKSKGRHAMKHVK
jgi:hypothetical protein